MIEFVGVSKKYGDIAALNSINLNINRGKTTVLLGTSGCGKSTLLRLIMGLCVPDQGIIRFDGVQIDVQTVTDVRLRIGYVLQEGGLFPHLTAQQNVALMANHHGWDSRRIEARIAELTALTHMESRHLANFPTELSGGQRQRIGLMRALMLDPDVLLMDEPLGALDPITRSELQSELADIFARLGKTVLMVTHDIREADFFADTVVLMDQGRIIQSGLLRNMLSEPATPFVQRFIEVQNHIIGSRRIHSPSGN